MTDEKRNDQLARLLATERQLCRRIQDNYALLKGKYAQLQAQLADTTTNYERQRHNTDERTDELEETIRKLTGELAQKVTFLEQIDVESRNNLEQFKTSLSEELKQGLQVVIQRLQNDCDQQRAENRALTAEAVGKDALLEQSCGIIAELKEQAEKWEMNAKEQFGTERKEMLDRIDVLTKDNKELNDQIDTLTRRKMETLDLQEALNAERSKTEQLKIDVLREQKRHQLNVDKSTETIESLSMEVDKLKRQALNLEHQLTVERQESYELRERLNTVDIQKTKEMASETATALREAQRHAHRRIAELERENGRLLAVRRTTDQTTTMEKEESRAFQYNTAQRLASVVNEVDETALERIKLLEEEIDRLKETCGSLKFRLQEEVQNATLNDRKWRFECDRLEKEVANLRKLTDVADAHVPAAEKIASLKVQLEVAQQQLKASDIKLAKAKLHYRSLLKRIKQSHKHITERYRRLQQANVFERDTFIPYYDGLQTKDIQTELDLISREIRETKKKA